MGGFSGKTFAFSHVAAGFIAVLVGYTSSAAIVFQAAQAAGASPAELASWLWALGLGMGISCIGLSLWFRSPILTAWSTPGAALLATSLVGVSMAQAIGAFMFASVLIAIVGLSGSFDRLMRHVPRSLAAAMLAGILLRFGLEFFGELPKQAGLLGAMLVIFLAGRRWLPRYAVALTFLGGVLLAAVRGTIHSGAIHFALTTPVFTAPEFSAPTLLGVGVPLFIVTMSSQNLPGIAVLRANGYKTPASPLVGSTGLLGILLAPWGGFSFNLAAITAAICMSSDADADPARRYLAAVWAGFFYLITGLLGGAVAGIFGAIPHALVLAIAGLALLGTIGQSLAGALSAEPERDAALVTFLVTASGMSLLGVGSAFWGLVFGLVWSRCGARK
ncbi:benzoate/H(+) symporter BenE family transporter [Niveibacterium terrae]|uniref:benzoate/H(+) symporter BenE family transporter n=1 Tax=Niveibacterium terrae TaxID=3373598 RepID=UPI003A8E81EC